MRFGTIGDPSSDVYLGIERVLNDLTRVALSSNTKSALAVAILDAQGNQVIPGGSVGGATTSRQVTLSSSMVTEITPTTDAREMHFYNNTGVSIRYGGTGISSSAGIRIFNRGYLTIKNPDSDFTIQMILEGGSDASIDIAEFF